MTGIKAITTDSPTSGSNMMLFGIGNVGGRAVFYALQRGSLPGLRLFAAGVPENLYLRYGKPNIDALLNRTETGRNVRFS